MEQIIQIIPADGWFHRVDCGKKLTRHGLVDVRIMAFGLTSEGKVVGIDANGQIIPTSSLNFEFVHEEGARWFPDETKGRWDGNAGEYHPPKEPA